VFLPLVAKAAETSKTLPTFWPFASATATTTMPHASCGFTQLKGQSFKKRKKRTEVVSA
jgi:hypothetical protein